MKPLFYVPGYEPGNVEDLVVPMGAILHIPRRPTTAADIHDMAYKCGGMASMPTHPFMVKRADGRDTMIIGAGVTEATELQDMAYEMIERKPDFDRESMGLKDQETMAERIREHMYDKAKWFQQNSVTARSNEDRHHEKRLF